MKSLLLGLSILSSVTFAGETGVWLRSNDEDYVTARLPQKLMATFVDQGFKQKEVSPGIFELSIKNVRCDFQSRDALFPDASNAGLPSVKCYTDAEIEMNGNGVKIQEGRYLNELFNIIQEKKDISITDCAMGGKCVSYVSTIQCWVDLNMEEMKDAYSCYLE